MHPLLRCTRVWVDHAAGPGEAPGRQWQPMAPVPSAGHWGGTSVRLEGQGTVQGC